MTDSAPALAAGTGASVVIERCQVCDSPRLDPVLFLGYLPPVNQMRAVGSAPREQPAYPARLLVCAECGLAQLGLVVDPRILFPPDYPYTSGTTRILRENFAELQAECRTLGLLPPGGLVVDIGSNDGTLLSNFLTGGQRVLGIEPTQAGTLARERGIETLEAFFGPEAASRARASHGPAAMVTAANVFAHIEDVHAVVRSVLALLDADGVFVSESHYFLSLVQSLQYDTIYHEHLRYYTLASLRHLLALHGLEVFHARRIPTHGGSFRAYAGRAGRRPIRASVAAMLEEERRAGLHAAGLEPFRRRVAASKLGLHALLHDLRGRGERVYGIGAPSRASTLISYVGLDDGILDCVVEVPGSRKIGKYMPGTLIPVVDEAQLFAEQPEVALLLSWHIADELMPKLTAKGFRGRYLIPLPEPRIVEGAARS